MINLVGREKEIAILNEVATSNVSEFVCVYGRRRVGKTFLINECFEGNFDFYYTGIYKIKNREQLNHFRNNLACKEKLNDWFMAFAQLKDYLFSLNKNIVTVFIDEVPWMDVKNSNFIKALADFWNTWPKNNNHIILKLIICGSAASWMINKVIRDKGGLYGRLTRKIYLSPFTLYETKEYLLKIKQMNIENIEVLNIYKVLGGIPYYLSLLNSRLDVNQNIDKLLFNENADLKNEYNYLINSLFETSSSYMVVIEAISKKISYGLTREEIIKETRIEGGTLSKILEDLINCDIIISNNSFNKKGKDKFISFSRSIHFIFFTFCESWFIY